MLKESKNIVWLFDMSFLNRPYIVLLLLKLFELSLSVGLKGHIYASPGYGHTHFGAI